MIRPVLVLVSVLTTTAPFQCASDPDPEYRLEDSPSEALWELAQRFEEEGAAAAQRTTLQQLVDRYPSSREAGRARQLLDAE